MRIHFIIMSLSVGFLWTPQSHAKAYKEGKVLFEVRASKEAPLKTVNQLLVSGNACGPAALLNSFQNGSSKWQQLANNLPGTGDRNRLLALIRGYCVRASDGAQGRKRWTPQRGMNLVDLTQVGNELRGRAWLPSLNYELLQRRSGERDEQLLSRAYKKIEKSLRKGLPPIMSVQWFSKKTPQSSWQFVQGHFIVVTALPRSYVRSKGLTSFEYIDPWGGVVRQGTLFVGQSPFQNSNEDGFVPCLFARVPHMVVGRELVKGHASSVLVVSSVLGAF